MSRWRVPFLAGLGWVVLMTAAVDAADWPDPYAHGPEPRIGPIAVPVMEQVFWVEIAIPPEQRVTVSAPKGRSAMARS